MKTTGTRIISENIEVSVDPLAILTQIYKATIPLGLSYIGKDNRWYRESGFDYHKREGLYAADRIATDEELELKHAYETFRKALKTSW